MRSSVRPPRGSVRPPRASDGAPISVLPKAPAEVIPLSRAHAARARMAPLITPPPPAGAPALPRPAAQPAPTALPAPAALPASSKPARSRALAAPQHVQTRVPAAQPLTLMVLSANGGRTRHIRLSTALLIATALVVSVSVAAAAGIGWGIGTFTAGL